MRHVFVLILLFAAQAAHAQNGSAPARSQDVLIDAGEVMLGATIDYPANARLPAPAVVLVHGSGPAGRRAVEFYRRAALEMGFIVVAYDKRGTGVSTGSFHRFSVVRSLRDFNALASDAAAVHRWLSAQPGVDANRVGYMGGSQAGWIMPLAAQRSGAAFIVIGCGTPLTAGQEDYHSRMTGEGRRPLSRRARREADRRAARFEGPHGFDPRPMLERAQTPMLWIFGTDDLVIPTQLSINEIERLRRAGRRNFALRVIDGMNHDFRIEERGARVALAPIAREWLGQIGVLSAPG